MIRRTALGVMLAAVAIFCGGCWDRIEINDIAMVMASSLDLREDGRYQGTLQIVIPARQIGNTSQKTKQYFVESGAGMNVQDLIQKEQSKLSRRLFIGHRRVLFIGESLARKGLKDILDHYSRNPTTRLHTYVVVVRGGEGRDALNTDYPLEFVPSEAVREIEVLAGGTAVTLRDLLIAASGEGTEPVMGVIELRPWEEGDNGKPSGKKTFDLNSTAIFKDLKLVGYLDRRDTELMLWVTGKLKKTAMVVDLPQAGSIASVEMNNAERTIDVSIEGGRPKYVVHLKGRGTVVENNSRLDFSDPKNLYLVEDLLVQSLQIRTEKLIHKVQESYGSDIFGFGETLHKKNNKAWQRLKTNWNEKFSEADVTVVAEFNVTGAGMSGAPLQLREQEVIK